MTATPTHPRVTPGAPVPSRWTTGRVLALVAAAIFLLLGAGLVLAGTGIAAVSAALRGDDGLYSSSTTTWSSPGHAVQSEPARMQGPMMTDLPHRMLGTVVVTADARGDADVLVGLARTADVGAYLRGVAHST